VGWDSAVDIVTRYELDNPGNKSWWRFLALDDSRDLNLSAAMEVCPAVKFS